VAAIGSHSMGILRLAPSRRIKTTRTTADTSTSRPKNAPMHVEKRREQSAGASDKMYGKHPIWHIVPETAGGLKPVKYENR
jgi:hypothetical protein